jgi:uncharacterized protein YcfL
MRGVFLLVLLTLVGCASSPANLQRETARVIGRNVAPQAIDISHINRGFATVTWHARAQGRTYECEADDRVHRPYCFEASR